MGVTRVTKNGRVLYRARLTWDGKRISAGYYNTEVEAEEACKRRLKQLYKERDALIRKTAFEHSLSDTIAKEQFSDEVKKRLALEDDTTQLFKEADIHRAVKPSLFKRIKQFIWQ